MMKNDINLIFRRKTAALSGKKLVILLVAVLILAGGLYAGIVLPSGALAAAKIELQSLGSGAAPGTSLEKELAAKQLLNTMLNVQLEELQSLGDSRDNISKYIEAIERAIPDTVNINSLNFEDSLLHINGFAADDTDIALFCLRLRQQDVFSSIYLLSSTTDENNNTGFTLAAALPVPLNGADIIESIQKKNAPPSAAPSSDGGTSK